MNTAAVLQVHLSWKIVHSLIKVTVCCQINDVEFSGKDSLIEALFSFNIEEF